VYTDIGDIAYFMISSLGFLKVELKVWRPLESNLREHKIVLEFYYFYLCFVFSCNLRVILKGAWH
jgi:hypothetical protein